MSWKKTFPYYLYQTIKYFSTWHQFVENWKNYFKWQSSQQSNRNSINDEWPWINFKVIDFLTQNLLLTHKVFEYGGGGSTLFFCRRAELVITVEHDETWFGILTDKIVTMGYKHWNGLLVFPDEIKDINTELSPHEPLHYVSSSFKFNGKSFERYVKSICQFPKQYFDLVLIDGRSRPSCIYESLKYVKIKGYVIVDNVERQYYLKALDIFVRENFDIIINQRGPTPYSPDFTITLVLQKK